MSLRPSLWFLTAYYGSIDKLGVAIRAAANARGCLTAKEGSKD